MRCKKALAGLKKSRQEGKGGFKILFVRGEEEHTGLTGETTEP